MKETVPAFAQHNTRHRTAPPPSVGTSVPLRFSPGNHLRKTASSTGGNLARSSGSSSRDDLDVGA